MKPPRAPNPFFSSLLLISGLFCGLCVSGCTSCEEEEQSVESKPAVTSTGNEIKSDEPEKEKEMALGHRFPVGPRMVFVPGKGVSAIRFGATTETIERHMGAPCDKKTEDRCLYVRAAVEFFLEDGKLVRLKAHRRDRKVENPPEGGDQYFGSLRGIVQPKIMLLLHKHVVLQEFGEPRKREEISPPAEDGLVERHYYDGIIFEYDKIANGNTVLSAIEVYPSESPYAPPRPTDEPAVPSAEATGVLRDGEPAQ